MKQIFMATIMVALVLTVSIIKPNQYDENKAFAAQVKSRHLTPFQSGFIDGYGSTNLGAFHSKAYYGGYKAGQYVACTFDIPRNPSDTKNCGDPPATNYRSDSYLAGYVDQKNSITNTLLKNTGNHSPSMKDYRAGYDDAANPCYGETCHR